MKPRKESKPPRRDFPFDRDHDANRHNEDHKNSSRYFEEAYEEDVLAGALQSQRLAESEADDEETQVERVQKRDSSSTKKAKH
jgi:hypothetical protein